MIETEPGASYLPRQILQAIGIPASGPIGPTTKATTGAVLLVDISGFTRLVESHSGQGAAGVEAVSRIIDRCFQPLVESVQAFGGEVLCFPGDSLLCIWTTEVHSSLKDAVAQAAACATQVIRVQGREREERLQLRAVLSAGNLSLGCTGGPPGRYHVLATGEAIDQLEKVAQVSQSGRLAVSGSAASFLGLETIEKEAVLVAVDWEAPQSIAARPLSEPASRKPDAFLPTIVLDGLSFQSSRWTAELRHVTSLFLGIPSAACLVLRDPILVQRLVQEVQTAVAFFEGEICQIVQDEKGLCVVAGWGLPAHAHENDPVRALLAAERLRDGLRALGLRPHIGVASGVVYCGDRGSAQRCEYAMIGSSVNLAARLMTAAEDSVLCDQATARLASGRIEGLEAAAPIQVKGHDAPVSAFRLGSTGSRTTSRRHQRDQIVGRQEERETLHRALQRLNHEGKGGLLLFEGEAGIGKSSLLAAAVKMAEAGGSRALMGVADSLDRHSPWLSWRSVFRGLLHVSPDARPESIETAIQTALAPWPERHQWTPLLLAALGLAATDNDITEGMSATARRDATIQVFADLLARETEAGPVTVVLDDIHWADSLSLSLCAALVLRDLRLLLVVGGRPPETASLAEYLSLRALAQDNTVRLGRMAGVDIEAVVSQDLGVSALPEVLHRFIQRRSEGHPFFAVELGLAVREAGLLTVQDGQATLSGSAQDLDALALPPDLRGVIAARIDRLSPRDQLTVRVASIFGRVFTLEELLAVFPEAASETNLGETLDALSRHELTEPVGTNPPSWSYRHAITHEVAYEQLLPSQRTQLHKTAADWLASTAEIRSGHHARLAHHYGLAGEVRQEIEHLELAGEDAARRGAYREAMNDFRRLISLSAGEGRAYIDAARLTRWYRHFGDACFGLGLFDESRASFSRAMTQAGRPLPTGIAWVSRLVIESARVLLSRLSGRSQAKQKTLKLEAARITGILAEQNYYLTDLPAFVGCTLLSVLYAEQAGTPEAAARGYSALGHLGGLGRLNGFANHCFRTSRAHPEDPRSIGTNDNIQGLTLGLFARFDEAIPLLERGLGVHRSVSDAFGQGSGLVMLGQIQDWHGRLTDAVGTFTRLREVSLLAGNRSHLVWALTLRAATASHLGRMGAANADLEEAERYLPEADALGPTMFAGIQALVGRRSGDLDMAAKGAARAIELIRQRPIPAFCYVWPYVGTAEAFVALAANSTNPSERKKHLKNARRAYRALYLLALIHPVFQARSLRVASEIATAEGRLPQGARLAERALKASERTRVEYDRALALLQLARLEPEGSASRSNRVAAALEAHRQLGAVVPEVDSRVLLPPTRDTALLVA